MMTTYISYQNKRLLKSMFKANVYIRRLRILRGILKIVLVWSLLALILMVIRLVGEDRFSRIIGFIFLRRKYQDMRNSETI